MKSTPLKTQKGGKWRRQIGPLIAVLLATCACQDALRPTVSDAIQGSSAVYLCDVDISGQRVRYKVREIVAMVPTYQNPVSVGQYMPDRGSIIETGIKYGDHAILFYSGGTGSDLPNHEQTFLFHNQRPGDLERLRNALAEIRSKLPRPERRDE
jgi:hypothetical protein